MPNTTNRTFSQEQITYMTAKAAVEVVKAKADAFHAANCPTTDDDAIVSAFIDAQDAHSEAIGYWKIKDCLREAENLLIDWARNEMANNPKTAAKFGQVAVVFEKAPKNPKFRPQLIDLCMRFAA